MNPKVLAGRSGFTLIELLMVISIIALLISILLPALKTARESGQALACLSNERQVNMAMLMYADDTDAYYPPAVILTPRYYWTELLVREGRYLSTLQVFDCPTFQSTNETWLNPPGGMWGQGSSNWRFSEIGYNYDFIGTSTRVTTSTDLTPARVTEIKKPSATIMLVDSVRLDTDTGWNTAFSYFHPTKGHAGPRHLDGVNVAWADGRGTRVISNDPVDAYDTDVLTDRFDNPNFWDRE